MSSNCENGLHADLVLLDGKVQTVDAKNSVAETVAVEGNRILAVGTNGEVSGAIGEGTEVIDLRGRAVLPGLIDQGIPAPGHSDCPVCSPNPWLGIYGLVTR